MDSLSQIVLGAAVGEAVLGKKVGNRAMLWGAVGGTIPDLDVVGNLFMDEMTALSFHRGITHSLLFAFTTPYLFGWLVWKFYHSDLYRKKGYKTVALAVWLGLFGLIAFFINYFPATGGTSQKLLLLLISALVLVMLAWTLYHRYYRNELEAIRATHWDWTMVFFWSIFTHPLLDAFTSFGTQLFYPFTDFRVAFNTIAVVDPLYTAPFLVCLLVASFLARTSRLRRLVNWIGISWSIAYLGFTVYNKTRFNAIFERALHQERIVAERYMTSPTIFNNILWQGIAETSDAYYFGRYSFLDANPEVDQITRLPKNHQVLEAHKQDRSVRILKWFSNGYFNILVRKKDGLLQFNDLRYGSRSNGFKNDEDYVFRFILKEENGVYHATQTREGMEVSSQAFTELFDRIKGIKKTTTE